MCPHGCETPGIRSLMPVTALSAILPTVDALYRTGCLSRPPQDGLGLRRFNEETKPLSTLNYIQRKNEQKLPTLYKVLGAKQARLNLRLYHPHFSLNSRIAVPFSAFAEMLLIPDVEIWRVLELAFAPSPTPYSQDLGHTELLLDNWDLTVFSSSPLAEQRVTLLVNDGWVEHYSFTSFTSTRSGKQLLFCPRSRGS